MATEAKKLIFDKIQVAENCFGDLCSEISNFNKKKSSLRDKYDEISRIFKIYGEAMRANATLSTGLLGYSDACTHLGDIQDITAQRIQSKTIRELAGYETICKNAREVLKQSLLQRGVPRKSNIDKSKSRGQNRNSFSQDTDQITHANSMQNEFESKVISFERQKIGDLREILLDFTLIQMQENVKALEILTEAHGHIADISIDDDLENFSQVFADKNANTLNGNNRSQSMSILDTMSTDSKQLGNSNLSNSAHSLNTLNKDTTQAHHRPSDASSFAPKKAAENSYSESDESEVVSEDETTESETNRAREQETTDSSHNGSIFSRGKAVAANRLRQNGSNDGITDNIKKSSNSKQLPSKPVPQVRFSIVTSRAK